MTEPIEKQPGNDVIRMLAEKLLDDLPTKDNLPELFDPTKHSANRSKQTMDQTAGIEKNDILEKSQAEKSHKTERNYGNPSAHQIRTLATNMLSGNMDNLIPEVANILNHYDQAPDLRVDKKEHASLTPSPHENSMLTADTAHTPPINDPLKWTTANELDRYEKAIKSIVAQANKIDTLVSEDIPTNKMTTSLDVNLLRNDFPILNKKINGYPLIWLDNAATSQKPNVVIQAVSNFYENENSNIHRGIHSLSVQASIKHEQVRTATAKFINARSEDEVIFVRGTTEGLNLIAESFGNMTIEPGDEILVSLLEHHSNILPWQRLAQQQGAKLKFIPIDKYANIDMNAYAKLLNSKTKIVALSHVSNAVGTRLPVKKMTSMAHDKGAYVVIDGAQSVPHFEVDVQDIGCDFFVFSSHKMFGPTGIGAVWGKYALLEQMPPYQVGGGMIEDVSENSSSLQKAPQKFEAGTSHLAGVIGLGATIDYLNKVNMKRIEAYEHQLVQYACERIKQIPYIKLIGDPQDRVSVISFLVKGMGINAVGKALDKQGIAVRTGHHCALPLMRAFDIEGTVRVSIAAINTKKEIDFLIMTLMDIIKNNQLTACRSN